MTDTTTTFHASTFGSFSAQFRADRDGYVHLTLEAARSGSWDGPGEPDDEWLEELADDNAAALPRAEADLAAWREQA